jgi:DNA-binding XRE family transcriptional regulator
MRHPWATRREQAGFTQENVSLELKVNRQTVIRLEQSLFHQPSVEVLTKLGELYAAPVGDLIEEYNEYVKEQRGEFAGRHPDFSVMVNYSGLKHPLVAYRESLGLSRMGLCRGLCLDYYPLFQYEANKQRGLPLELKRACEDMKWDWTKLDREVVLWRLSGRANKLADQDDEL